MLANKVIYKRAPYANRSLPCDSSSVRACVLALRGVILGASLFSSSSSSLR